MFARKEKPLPVAVLKPETISNTQQIEDAGIHLGEGYFWNPETLPNGHIVAIGASGSGKTQTLKARAYSLHQTYPEMQIILLDFHGDQEIIGETCYPIHMASPHGINPLVVNLDPEGGGSNLQAIQIAGILKKSLRLGPNQEGMLIEIIKTCYQGKLKEVRRSLITAIAQSLLTCPYYPALTGRMGKTVYCTPSRGYHIGAESDRYFKHSKTHQLTILITNLLNTSEKLQELAAPAN